MNQSKLRLELPRIYWINLNRATERRDRMLRAFADFRLPSQRIEAIDGDDKELLAKTIKCDQSTMEKMPHLVAGLASHFIAIRSALMQGDEAALFLEDDVSFEFLSRYPYSYRELLSTLPVGWSGLWLTYGDRPTRLNRIFSMSRLTLQVPYRTLWSTTAYVLSRPAMQYLCNSYWKGDHLDFTDFHDRHESDTVLLRSLATAKLNSPPYIARIPMFVHDGIDTLIRDTSGLTYQQRIRKFIVTAYPKLVSGTYAGQKTVWPLLTRALNWVRAFTA